MSKEKSYNESLITTFSIVMLLIVAVTIVIVMMNNDSDTDIEATKSDAAVMPLSQSMERDVPPVVTPAPDTQPLIQKEGGNSSDSPGEQPAAAAALTPEEERMNEITARFEQGVVMLHAKEFEHAATALHRVMELSPRMPEVYVNMGYAKLGQRLYQEAVIFFETATQLKPEQANAYWGMAVAYENSGDLPAALGAMRTFIHLSPGDDSFLRRARSALWEWEETLARGPLPEAEKEFLERGALQWESRNTPRDDVDSGEQDLQVQPIQ